MKLEKIIYKMLTENTGIHMCDSGGDVFENDVIALSIHNGCDARGGLTDYKFFKIDWDSFLNYSSDYYDQEDTKKMYVEARA